jgi:nucleotide-binding universal stress UspA family protein
MTGGTIVVGCDASDCAYEALGVALELAQELGASLVIAYAIEPPVRSVGEEFGAHPEALEELGEQVTEPALERARQAGVDAEAQLVSQRPAAALLNLAAKHDARLIVVGSYGESPLRGAVLGSVPHKLLQVSDRPVLVVPRTSKEVVGDRG